MAKWKMTRPIYEQRILKMFFMLIPVYLINDLAWFSQNVAIVVSANKRKWIVCNATKCYPINLLTNNTCHTSIQTSKFDIVSCEYFEYIQNIFWTIHILYESVLFDKMKTNHFEGWFALYISSIMAKSGRITVNNRRNFMRWSISSFMSFPCIFVNTFNTLYPFVRCLLLKKNYHFYFRWCFSTW